ncbi:MAG: PRC-barrel domain-containing protein [Actinomycetota bacterium]|nr:PRC-barrel domain-containing protein [Actinomycetota bacterium]
MTTPAEPMPTPPAPPMPDPATTPDIPPIPEPAEVPTIATIVDAAAKWTASDWLGKVITDRAGDKIGKLHDVYVDVETDEPQFGTVKVGLINRHLTFVPLMGVSVGPDELRVRVLKEQVNSAPDLNLHGQELSQADESVLYHHFQMNYTAIASESGRRLARR